MEFTFYQELRHLYQSGTRIFNDKMVKPLVSNYRQT